MWRTILGTSKLHFTPALSDSYFIGVAPHCLDSCLDWLSIGRAEDRIVESRVDDEVKGVSNRTERFHLEVTLRIEYLGMSVLYSPVCTLLIVRLCAGCGDNSLYKSLMCFEHDARLHHFCSNGVWICNDSSLHDSFDFDGLLLVKILYSSCLEVLQQHVFSEALGVSYPSPSFDEILSFLWINRKGRSGGTVSKHSTQLTSFITFQIATTLLRHVHPSNTHSQTECRLESPS